MRRVTLPLPLTFAACLLLTSVAFSSFRVTFAPGLEFYFGPFFYLLALRWFGLRTALGVAFLCMLPTLFWWDHPVSLALALVHVLFVDRFLRRGWTAAGSTLLFNLTISAVAGIFFLKLFYDIPLTMICVQLLRKLINETLVAAAADCVSLLFSYSAASRTISRAKEFRLSAAITKSLLLFGMVMTTLLFRTEVQFFSLYLTARIHDLDTSVLAHAGAAPTEKSLVIRGTPVRIFGGHSPGTESAIRQQVESYQCRFIESDDLRSHGGTRSRFDYWVDGCRVHHMHSRGQHLVYVAPLRTIALDGYQLIFAQSFKFLLIVIAAVSAGAVVRRTLATSADRWKEVVGQFGQGEISSTDVAPIAEFQASIAAFIEANNRFVRLQRERERTRSTMAKLSDALNLSLIENIEFRLDEGVLTFRRIEEEGLTGSEMVLVRRADRHSLGDVGNEDEISVEFRVEGEASDRWHLIVARERTGPHSWASGCILRLRPARHAIEQLAHHARLTELGAMASAIGHELKQPLFSISLSAELGLADLERGASRSGDPHRRFVQIKGQVDRARQIIARMSQYARSDAGVAEPFRLTDAVSAAAAFLRPMLVSKDVAITVGGNLDAETLVRMRRIALEQIIVNALQNSLDSIETRLQGAPGGDKGVIAINCCRDADGIELTIRDNGMGLDGISAEEAFQAFATTKSVGKGTGLGLYISREIAQEVGGSIQLSPAEGGGALFSLRIPENAIVERDDSPTREAA